MLGEGFFFKFFADIYFYNIKTFEEKHMSAVCWLNKVWGVSPRHSHWLRFEQLILFIYLFSHSQNLIQHEQKLLIKL